MIFQLNNTISIDALAQFADGFFKLASTLLGGIFGLYLISAIFKIINERKLFREIHTIRLKLEEISSKLQNESRNKK